MVVFFDAKGIGNSTGQTSWILIPSHTWKHSHGTLVASASSPIILPDGASKLQMPLLFISYAVSYIFFLTSFHPSYVFVGSDTQLTLTVYKVLIVYGDKD
ncbi:hypothetical protein CROQUDRAFT_676058 [Cronartium quercuum f. sp. fusiforme G11]|uniref:Uncharacterized protein n=1 Tax=Cronartium quercuum f. sp. fusiforme G11 TaxID=708437 RepID=A0A9P6NY16_9BASI|nr:hypothetical protein CROQUDRAFT_676058 [Cronartium quercuum f. sp. fusiforme G11]